MRHIGFWLIYFIITFVNELFVTSDFAGATEWSSMFHTALSVFNILLLKIVYVYYLVYFTMPKILAAEQKLRAMVPELLLFLIVIILHRIINYFNWIYIYKQVPQMSVLALAARLLYSFVDVVQIVAIVIGIKYFKLRITQEQKEKELMTEKARSELVHLKSQINPHFLFNMLNSIYSLSLAKSDQAPQMVSDLSSLLRYMLYDSEKMLVSVDEELRNINDYINLQSIRFEHKLEIYKSFELDQSKSSITPLLLFPIIENMFKHGVGSKADQCYIKINLTLKDHQLILNTENKIIPHAFSNQEKKGIGLENITRQLNILYHQYTFTQLTKDQHYYTTLTINLTSYKGHELYHH
jgi:sensor histidine kinase YesM